MSRYSIVRSPDGTRLRMWSNADALPADAVPLVISNGLGSTPDAWPLVIRPSSGFRAVTWAYRGLSGSERPQDPTAIQVADHAADLGAVMDAGGMDRALVAAWSIGVNIAFEFARQNPERVSGILAVAGVPGAPLTTMYASAGLPRELRESAGRASAHLLRVTGPWLTAMMAATPRGDSARGAEETDQLGPAGPASPLGAVLREFAGHDWDWYSSLVLAAGEHEPMDLSAVRFPVSLLAGRHDVIASSADIVRVAGTIPGARAVVLPAATHLLPLQYPEVVLDELRRLAQRASG